MSELFKILAELLRESNGYKFSCWKIIAFFVLLLLFILITALTLFNPLKWENQELLKSIWEASFYIFSFFILVFWLSFWALKRENKIIKFEDITNILKNLQEKFKSENLTNCKVDDEVIFWKNLFKINETLYIVATIDDDNLTIRNFFIRSSNKEDREKINKIKEKNINDNEVKKWGYKYTHITYNETLEMCEKWEYEEAIKFLLNILEESKINFKKT